VIIGKHVVVSQHNYVCSATHDYTHPHFPLISKAIHIRSQSWVASGCLISPGVTIGEGTVIGARSVVTKSMPDWTVCAGSPCKPIKARVIQG
jgi:putative colanic acid biosynthesis acetyltransferase WcaF